MVKSATLSQLANINLDKQWFSCTDTATFVQSKPNFISRVFRALFCVQSTSLKKISQLFENLANDFVTKNEPSKIKTNERALLNKWKEKVSLLKGKINQAEAKRKKSWIFGWSLFQNRYTHNLERVESILARSLEGASKAQPKANGDDSVTEEDKALQEAAKRLQAEATKAQKQLEEAAKAQKQLEEATKAQKQLEDAAKAQKQLEEAAKAQKQLEEAAKAQKQLEEDAKIKREFGINLDDLYQAIIKELQTNSKTSEYVASGKPYSNIRRKDIINSMKSIAKSITENKTLEKKWVVENIRKCMKYESLKTLNRWVNLNLSPEYLKELGLNQVHEAMEERNIHPFFQNFIK